MGIDASKMFQELKVDGDTFGSVKYFDAKRKYTVFSLCISGRSSVDCEEMVKNLQDLIKKQADEIKDDFKSAKGDLFNVSDSCRRDMERFIDSLYDAIRKVGGSFSKSELTEYLDEYRSPNKSAKRGSSKPHGKNGAELCSYSYRDKIREAIFGSSQSSRNFSSAIEDDVKKITGSIYDDLKDSLSSIYRVSENHKKSIIDAMQTFRGIVNGSRAVEVIGILNYTAELTLPLPEQTMFSREKLSFKPITVISKELLNGHQNFEEYLRRNRGAQFHAKQRYITAEYVEKYSSEISKYIKAALVLDTDDNVIYIVLYVNDTEVFRTKYTDVNYSYYVKEGNERLRVYSLKCKAFSDKDVASANRENWNSNMELSGTIAEGLSIIAEGLLQRFPPLKVVGQGLRYGGQILQASSYTFKLSRDKLDVGDFELYYGNSDKGYGGVFSGNTFKKKE